MKELNFDKKSGREIADGWELTHRDEPLSEKLTVQQIIERILLEKQAGAEILRDSLE